jgi:hypothetical protein
MRGGSDTHTPRPAGFVLAWGFSFWGRHRTVCSAETAPWFLLHRRRVVGARGLLLLPSARLPWPGSGCRQSPHCNQVTCGYPTYGVLRERCERDSLFVLTVCPLWFRIG